MESVKTVSVGEKIWITTREAAALLSVSPRTLWQWTKDKLVPSVKQGRMVRYNPEELRAWANRFGGKPDGQSDT